MTRGSKTYILQRRNYGVIALDDDCFRLVCRACISDSWVRTSKYVFTNMIDAAFYADLDRGRVTCNRCSFYARASATEEAKWIGCVPGNVRQMARVPFRPPPSDDDVLDNFKHAAAEEAWAGGLTAVPAAPTVPDVAAVPRGGKRRRTNACHVVEAA